MGTLYHHQQPSPPPAREGSHAVARSSSITALPSSLSTTSVPRSRSSTCWPPRGMPYAPIQARGTGETPVPPNAVNSLVGKTASWPCFLGFSCWFVPEAVKKRKKLLVFRGIRAEKAPVSRVFLRSGTTSGKKQAKTSEILGPKGLPPPQSVDGVECHPPMMKLEM